MNKTQRFIIVSLSSLVIWVMLVARIAKTPDFQQNPVASMFGSSIPVILVAFGVYWLLGKKEGPFPLQKSRTIHLIIAVTGIGALVFVFLASVSDSTNMTVITPPQTPPPPAITPPQAQHGDANGSPYEPIRLPEDAITSCKVKGGPIQNGVFEAEVYNGSPEWHISAMVVTIKVREEARTFKLYPLRLGTIDSSGRVLPPPALRPLSTGNFTGNIGTFLDGLKQGEWQLSHSEMDGYKQP